MNQDSEQNDRRDGEPQGRPGRSFDRRDDDRTGDQRPRFNRDASRQDNDRRDTGRRNENGGERRNDSPRFNRSNASDRRNDAPRFNRDTDRRDFNNRDNDRRDAGRRDNAPSRFDRPNDRNRDTDNRSGDAGDRRPRFDRDRPIGSGNSRPDGPRNRDDNRSDRNDRRPSFDRNSGSRDDKPRFNRSGDSNEGKPRFERNNDRFGSERRFTERNDERRSNGGRSSGDDANRPSRFERGDRNRPDEARGNDRRPSFDRNAGSRDDKPRFNRNSDNARNDGPRRFDRPNDERRDADRRDSRVSRDRNDKSDKPAFKRVGGFNREADERNRFGGDDKRNGGSDAERSRSRFTSEQRKESGDRRTGNYDKAPNYNLEQKRDRYAADRSKRPSSDNRNHSNESADSGLTRLNRYIANSGVCSRREADELIARGDISVNGKVVTEMGYKVKEGDTVKFGTKVLNPERFVYVLLNKPKDYITTTDDPEERRTVMELVADAGNFRMYPVGRLDRNTTGLLLLTNDGELADKLTHPSYNIRKIYQVELDKPITDEHFEAIQKGVELEDGLIKPDALSIVTPDAHVIGIEIHSGRNRIVRRIFENFGYEVTKLDRTTYAGLTKKDLPRGKWRFLDPKEVVKLKYFN